MGINNEYPIVDGVAVSWADIAVTITPIGGALAKTVDISAIHTGRSVEVGYQRGATGGRKKKRTTGQSDEEASITFYRDGFQAFYRALAKIAPARGNQLVVGLVVFGVQMQWTPLGSVEIFERRVKGARIIGDTIDGAEGSDADTVEVPLSVMEIVDIIDGKEVVLL
jgi:hypothetical protein